MRYCVCNEPNMQSKQKRTVERTYNAADTLQRVYVHSNSVAKESLNSYDVCSGSTHTHTHTNGSQQSH